MHNIKSLNLYHLLGLFSRRKTDDIFYFSQKVDLSQKIDFDTPSKLSPIACNVKVYFQRKVSKNILECRLPFIMSSAENFTQHGKR